MKYRRVIDANLNRVCEGLRVLEDIVRFVFDSFLYIKFRNLRHSLRKLFPDVSNFRRAAEDVGRSSELGKISNLKELCQRNFYRVEEGLRVVEEILRVIDNKKAKKIKQFRFAVYELHSDVLKLFKTVVFKDFFIYLITEHSVYTGKSYLKDIEYAVKKGVKIVQLREKGLSIAEKLRLGKAIREITRRYGALFIVNDRPDVAVCLQADGVHLGEDDIPPEEVKNNFPYFIIGYSPASMEDALKNEPFVDYMGIGPVFETSTKPDAGSPIGVEGLKKYVQRLKIPVVAVGGITFENLPQLLETGAAGVAVSSGILKGDVRKNLQEFLRVVG